MADKFRFADLPVSKRGHVKKLELTKNLKEECQITNNEAAIIVDLFFEFRSLGTYIRSLGTLVYNFLISQRNEFTPAKTMGSRLHF